VSAESPADAVQRARRTAAEQRAQGAYDDDLQGFSVRAPERRSQEQLLEWAVIEPDLELVRSTRWWGAPITFVKRAAVRVLRQYLDQARSQETRFNMHLIVRVAELEDRLADLELWAGQRDATLFPEGGPGVRELPAPPPPAAADAP
jgi:hypothetical protein